MGIRKRPFEWLFLILKFLTLRVAKLCECGDFLFYLKNLSTLFACACVNLVEMVLISPVVIFLSNTDADPGFSSWVVTDVELIVPFFALAPPAIAPIGPAITPPNRVLPTRPFCLFFPVVVVRSITVEPEKLKFSNS